MSRDKNRDALVVGGEPRVDLLPQEIRNERRGKTTRRRLVLGVLGVAVVAVLAAGGSFVLAAQAEAALVAEQARTAELLAEQLKYTEVRDTQNQVTLVEAAQQVGVSTEIDWKAYLENVQLTLPPSVSIVSVDIDSASPFAIYGQPTAPLQGPRVATLSFTAESAVFPDVPSWLTTLATLPGYADALPGSIQLDLVRNVYTVDIVMHVNDQAYSKRFAPVAAADDAAAAEGTEATENTEGQ